MRPTSRIGVLGAGRLGTTLAIALNRCGIRVTHVASARMQSAQHLALRLPSSIATTPAELCESADIVFLTLPDDAIAPLTASVRFRSDQSLLHCSGALELAVLDRARAAGAAIGCLHPLQTFPERFGDPSKLASIAIGIEASDTELLAWLEHACAALGANSVQLAGVDRAAYHAAAVLSSNYVIALHAAAAHAWQLAGLPAALARQALAPLTIGAALAIERLPLEAALTGPIARADVGTLERHLSALARSPDLLALYRALGQKLLDLPIDWSPEQRAQLTALLSRS